MVILENEVLKVSIHPHGAELHSLYNKDNGIEYIWNGDEKFWPRHSPVLFPIVGGLINDTFNYEGNSYKLEKHGFARDLDFQIEESSSATAVFLLQDSAETLKKYPFKFELRLIYELHLNQLKLTYEVTNPDNKALYFSIGAHPAFNVPFIKGTVYEDYYLQFEKEETAQQWKLNGNILTNPVPYFDNESKMSLNHEMFYNDAIIFKDLKSNSITIKSDKTDHSLTYNFKDLPYMGIWAAEDAPFVCIEPWCGIPDGEKHDQNIENKEGIISLQPGKSWFASWNLQVS